MSVGCGGDDSGPGSTTVTVPGEATADYSTLSADEHNKVCKGYVTAAYNTALNNKNGACVMAGVLASTFGGFGDVGGGGDEVVNLCEQIASLCKSNPNPLDTVKSCDGYADAAATCTATVETVQTCMDEELAAQDAMFKAFATVECSDITSPNPPDLSGMAPEATELCQTLKQDCPGVIANSAGSTSAAGREPMPEVD